MGVHGFIYLFVDLESDGNGDGAGDLGFSKWLESFQRNPGLWVCLFFSSY